MSDSFTGHRPGNLKQQNKTHKAGKHKTKGALNDGFKVERTHNIRSVHAAINGNHVL